MESASGYVVGIWILECLEVRWPRWVKSGCRLRQHGHERGMKRGASATYCINRELAVAALAQEFDMIFGNCFSVLMFKFPMIPAALGVAVQVSLFVEVCALTRRRQRHGAEAKISSPRPQGDILVGGPTQSFRGRQGRLTGGQMRRVVADAC